MTYPYGVVDDVFVKVDKFIFLADFLALSWKRILRFQLYWEDHS